MPIIAFSVFFFILSLFILNLILKLSDQFFFGHFLLIPSFCGILRVFFEKIRNKEKNEINQNIGNNGFIQIISDDNQIESETVNLENNLENNSGNNLQETAIMGDFAGNSGSSRSNQDLENNTENNVENNGNNVENGINTENNENNILENNNFNENNNENNLENNNENNLENNGNSNLNLNNNVINENDLENIMIDLIHNDILNRNFLKSPSLKFIHSLMIVSCDLTILYFIFNFIKNHSFSFFLIFLIFIVFKSNLLPKSLRVFSIQILFVGILITLFYNEESGNIFLNESSFNPLFRPQKVDIFILIFIFLSLKIFITNGFKKNIFSDFLKYSIIFLFSLIYIFLFPNFDIFNKADFFLYDTYFIKKYKIWIFLICTLSFCPIFLLSSFDYKERSNLENINNIESIRNIILENTNNISNSNNNLKTFLLSERNLQKKYILLFSFLIIILYFISKNNFLNLLDCNIFGKNYFEICATNFNSLISVFVIFFMGYTMYYFEVKRKNRYFYINRHTDTVDNVDGGAVDNEDGNIGDGIDNNGDNVGAVDNTENVTENIDSTIDGTDR